MNNIIKFWGPVISAILCFFLISNPQLWISSLIYLSGNYFSARFPIESTESLINNFLVQYNGLVLVFGFFFIVHAFAGICYVSINYILKHFNPVASNISLLNSIKLRLWYILLVSFVIMFTFALVFITFFYFNDHLALDLSRIFEKVYKRKATIAYLYNGNFPNFYVSLLAILAKLICYSRLIIIVKSLNKANLIFNYNNLQFDPKFNRTDYIKNICVTLVLLSIIRHYTFFINSLLNVQSLKKNYILSLSETMGLINLAHIILLISLLGIIIFSGLWWLVDRGLKDEDIPSFFANFPKTIDNLFNQDLLLIKGISSLMFLLAYYTLFITSLVILTNYIPSFFIFISLEYGI